MEVPHRKQIANKPCISENKVFICKCMFKLYNKTPTGLRFLKTAVQFFSEGLTEVVRDPLAS